MKPERQSPATMAEERELSPSGRRTGSSGRRVRRLFRSSTHFRSLLDGLLTLRQTGILFDVVLLVEGRPIQAHRILLAASCDYFRYAGVDSLLLLFHVNLKSCYILFCFHSAHLNAV